MKKIVMAAGAMAGIIAVQMGLSYVFGWKSAEIFSQIAVDVLFLSCLLMIGRGKVAK